ncbi:MAG: TlpA disulfide reductase family protein [Vicinamibacterales bacterium]
MQIRAFVVAVVLVVGVAVQAAEAQTQTLVQQVRAALNTQNFGEAERILTASERVEGRTPMWLEAYSWLGRAALAAKQYDRADRYAQQAHQMALAALKSRTMDQEPRLPIALGAAIEVQGHLLAETGARSEGVAFLQREFNTYKSTSIAMRIQKNLNLLTLEGTRAPELDRSEGLGGKTLSLADVKGKVTVLFFWAHWCPDCKNEAPILEALLDKYKGRDFAIVAPTQRYGYAVRGTDASPAEEKKHIEQVRQQYYSFLPQEAVQLAPANHLRYGVSTTPTMVVLDRQGIVRAYRPGNMSRQELETLIDRYLAPGTAGQPGL